MVVDPLLRLAARGALPAAETGRLLGMLGRRTRYEADPALPSLELAARQGPHAEVWTILRHFLAVFLPREERAGRAPAHRRRHAGDRGPHVDGCPGRSPRWPQQVKRGRGSTSLGRACRGLHDFLTRADPASSPQPPASAGTKATTSPVTRGRPVVPGHLIAVDRRHDLAVEGEPGCGGAEGGGPDAPACRSPAGPKTVISSAARARTSA